MPCRPEDTATSLQFPDNFTPDTDPFRTALAEHNWRRTVAGLDRRSFLDLEKEEQHIVLDRAQELKNSSPSGTAHLPGTDVPRTDGDRKIADSVAVPAPTPAPDPWWIRFFLFLHRAIGVWF